MKVALDTNVLAHAEGVDDAARRDAALDLIARLAPERVVLPAQALGELLSVLVRKAGLNGAQARDRLMRWTAVFDVADTTKTVVEAASALAAEHHLGIWDAVILGAASEAGCRLLLSEDMHDGFVWGGVTVVNPFTAARHPLLAAALE